MSFFDDLKKTINRSVAQANQKSQRVIEMSRLTFKIKGKKEEMERLFAQLGTAAYQAWAPLQKWEQTEEITKILQGIQSIEQEIRALEREYAQLKEQSQTTAPTTGVANQELPQLNTPPIPPQPVAPQTSNVPNTPQQNSVPNLHTIPDQAVAQQQTPVELQQTPKNQNTPTSQQAPVVTPTPTTLPNANLLKVLYICPFCAHQVAQEDSSCPNCQQRFY
jgi:hypothetical protein